LRGGKAALKASIFAFGTLVIARSEMTKQSKKRVMLQCHPEAIIIASIQRICVFRIFDWELNATK
jgi:hypothetical protein